jgi:hypothetical protein
MNLTAVAMTLLVTRPPAPDRATRFTWLKSTRSGGAAPTGAGARAERVAVRIPP